MICSGLLAGGTAIVVAMIKVMPSRGHDTKLGPGVAQVCVTHESRIAQMEQVVVRLDERMQHIQKDVADIKTDINTICRKRN